MDVALLIFDNWIIAFACKLGFTKVYSRRRTRRAIACRYVFALVATLGMRMMRFDLTFFSIDNLSSLIALGHFQVSVSVGVSWSWSYWLVELEIGILVNFPLLLVYLKVSIRLDLPSSSVQRLRIAGSLNVAGRLLSSW